MPLPWTVRKRKKSVKYKAPVSKYTGVSRGGSRKYNYNYWISRIVVRSKTHYLGCYRTEADAARAYNKKAKALGRKVNIISEDKERSEGVFIVDEKSDDDCRFERIRGQGVPSFLEDTNAGRRNKRKRGGAFGVAAAKTKRDIAVESTGNKQPVIKKRTKEQKVTELSKRGIDPECSRQALQMCRWDVQRATEWLARQAEAIKLSSKRPRLVQKGEAKISKDDTRSPLKEEVQRVSEPPRARNKWEECLSSIQPIEARARIRNLLLQNAVDTIQILQECLPEDFQEMNMLMGDRKRILISLRKLGMQ
mmetsp:Transcript_40877/g.65710  ORF Transcript_40877/g.65710 Transcript_40877/m.65710 type:complete len:307 (-) Transcript_40877:171-1091(-)